MTVGHQPNPPSGVVTFLFSDVVGSTRAWATQPEAMEADLLRHEEVIRGTIEQHGGYIFFSAGDSFGVAFEAVSTAVAAAIVVQRALQSVTWQLDPGIEVRLGIHVGEAVERGGDYFGTPVNVTNRLMSAAHGGQIVLSGAAANLAPDVETLALGQVQLRDVDQPVEAFQVTADGLAEEHPPLRGSDSVLSNLPAYRSSFIGRGAEVDRVRALLAEHRLVTVTGVGGAGKTRVAVEAAAAARHDYDAVLFVDLSPVDAPTDVVLAFAAGTELQVTTEEQASEELARYVAGRSVLLVVDNCEHLLDSTADLVDELLNAGPGLRVLATSREALEIEGEEAYRLPSLDPEEEGLRLFVERSTAANQTFELDDHNRAVVREICVRLDGIPLAVELAAARTRSSSPQELLDGLDDRFSLLRAGRRRGVLQRQRTLEGAIEWSYHLLEPEEQRFFMRLGVFAGPFLFELVPITTGCSRTEALDLLDALVAKSLVAVSAAADGSSSYRLLETIRAYALERLREAGQVEDAASAHLQALLDFAGDFSTLNFFEPGFHFRYRHQVAEVFSAADRAIASGRVEDTIHLLSIGGYALAGTTANAGLLDRLARTRELVPDDLHVDLRMRLEGELAASQMIAGDFLAVIRTIDGALAASEGSSPEARSTLSIINSVMLGVTDPVACERFVEASLDEWREVPDSDRVQVSVQHAGIGAIALQRRYEDAWEIAMGAVAADLFALYEIVYAEIGWLAHLLDRDVPELAPIPAQPAGWNFAKDIGLCMGSKASLDDKARQLVDIARRQRHGRMINEETEYLTAFGRLALLRGDEEHARTLFDACAGRSPWAVWVLSESIGKLDRWTDEDWTGNCQQLVFSRLDPTANAAAREAARPLLDAELETWA